MMQSMKLALVALCMCVGAVSASADGHIKGQIEAANDALAAAIAAGDAEAAGAAYTMDGQALPPGGTVITGPAAIGAISGPPSITRGAVAEAICPSFCPT